MVAPGMRALSCNPDLESEARAPVCPTATLPFIFPVLPAILLFESPLSQEAPTWST